MGLTTLPPPLIFFLPPHIIISLGILYTVAPSLRLFEPILLKRFFPGGVCRVLGVS